MKLNKWQRVVLMTFGGLLFFLQTVYMSKVNHPSSLWWIGFVVSGACFFFAVQDK